jgi:phage tail-like protein
MDFGKLTLYRRGEQPQEFRLRLGSLSVGSDPTADVSVDDASVHPFHLRVVCTPAGCQITDLGSQLGTTVNKERVAPYKPVRLADGDRILLGRVGLLYTAPKTVAAPPPEPRPAPEAAPVPAVEPTLQATPGPAPATAADPAPTASAEPAPTGSPEPAPEPAPSTEPRPQAAPSGPAPTTAPRPSAKTQPLTAAPDEWATLFELPAATTTQNGPLTVLPSNRRRRLPRNEERELPYEAGDYLALLPPIYHDDRFLRRYLLIFKSILSPLDRQIAQLNHYFDPRVAPEQLLPWLAAWVDLALDERWPDGRRRELIGAASVLYRWRGTRRGLRDYLRIYLGPSPTIHIVEQGQEREHRQPALPAHTFQVIIEAESLAEIDRAMVERIIEFEKPAHTNYRLELRAA